MQDILVTLFIVLLQISRCFVAVWEQLPLQMVVLLMGLIGNLSYSMEGDDITSEMQ